MDNYYMLECYATPDKWEFQNIMSYPRIEGIDSWLLGKPFTIEITQHIELQWDPETHGYRKSLYDAVIPLYRREVIKALHEVGVDNLVTYPTRISDTVTGEICQDYLAVNIIGLVSAADLEESSYTKHSQKGLFDTDFDSLAIDKAKVANLLFFRLAECVTGTVVHRKVKQHLESKKDFDLTFVQPKNWIG
ncbi:MAG: hypothetical protein ACYSWP_21860 [Planctomycetota bacterium]|jgi:hypothetical protein